MPSRKIRSDSRSALLAQDRAARIELNNTLIEIALGLIAYYKDVTSRWKHKPEFAIETKISPVLIRVDVSAVGKNADIFGYVDKGTGKAGGFRGDRYPITPKGDYPLRFQGNYNPYTQPVAQYDVGDGSRSGDWVSTYLVMHPGIKPRKFTEQAEANILKTFRRDVENAIRRGIRKAR